MWWRQDIAESLTQRVGSWKHLLVVFFHEILKSWGVVGYAYYIKVHIRECNKPLAWLQSGPWRQLSVEKLEAFFSSMRNVRRRDQSAVQNSSSRHSCTLIWQNWHQILTYFFIFFTVDGLDQSLLSLQETYWCDSALSTFGLFFSEITALINTIGTAL